MSNTTTVSPLRQRMIEDMAAPSSTHIPNVVTSKAASVRRLAQTLADMATPDEVRGFQLHLIRAGRASATAIGS